MQFCVLFFDLIVRSMYKILILRIYLYFLVDCNALSDHFKQKYQGKIVWFQTHILQSARVYDSQAVDNVGKENFTITDYFLANLRWR